MGVEEGRGEVAIWCKREFNGKRSFEVGLRRRYPEGLFRALNRDGLLGVFGVIKKMVKELVNFKLAES